MDKHDKEFEAYLRQFRLRQPGPPPEIASASRRSSMGWLLVAAVVVLAVGISAALVRNYGSGGGPKVTVESAGSPSLYRVGETIEAGQTVRSNSAVGLMLALEDGSRIEMREQSELKLESAADGIRVRLNDGSIVVTAAKQAAGRHLYVQTRDAMVSVVGTVFLVNAEQSGTTVAVVEGEVHVQQGAELKKLLPGEQMATNSKMQLKTVAEQISWSRRAAEFVALLPQSPAATQEPQTPNRQRSASRNVPSDSNPQATGPERSSLSLFRMAESSFEQGQFNVAVQLFRESLSADLNPKWLEVWARINIGKIYDVRSNHDRAVAEYQRAIDTGDDTYGAQAEAKKYLAVPFRLSTPAQQAMAVPIPSLIPAARQAEQQQPPNYLVGKQTFDRECTSCHSADVGMRPLSYGQPVKTSGMLASAQAELAQLLMQGKARQHPDVLVVQARLSALLKMEAEIKNDYSSFVLSHLAKFGKTISGAGFPALVEYAYGESIRRAETQGTSAPQDRPVTPPAAPVQPNDKDAPREDPDVAGARILNSACTSCHDLGAVTGKREDRASWERIVNGMIGYGAGVKDSEIPILVDYLFRHYGPKKEAPVTPIRKP